MKRAEFITAILLMVLSGYLMLKSTELSIGWIPDEGPGGGFWPFWLAAMMLGSSIWVLVNALRGKTPASTSDEPFMDDYAVKQFALVGGGVLGMAGMVYVVGMHLATSVFFVYYLRFLGRHTWRLTLTIAAASPVIIFFFFDVALRKFLPTGLMEPLYLVLYDIFL